MWHDSFICDITRHGICWHHLCDALMWQTDRDSTGLHVTWLVYMWHHSSRVSLTSLMWRTHITKSSWHDLFACHMTCLLVTLLVYMWHHSSRDLLTSLMWRSHVTNRSWHDSFTCDMTCLYVTSLVTDCDTTCHTWHHWSDALMWHHCCDALMRRTNRDTTRWCVTWLVDMLHELTWRTHVTNRSWHDLFTCHNIHVFSSCDRHVFVMWRTGCNMTLLCATSLICICDMTHAYVWHGSLMCSISLRGGMTHWCVAWLIGVSHDSWMYSITHLDIWHDSLMCGMAHWCVALSLMWLIYVRHDLCMSHILICHMTRSWSDSLILLIHLWLDSLMWLIYVRHNLLMCGITYLCVAWLIDLWYCSRTGLVDLPHWYVTWLVDVWHDSWIRDMTCQCVTWLVDVWHDLMMCAMTHRYDLLTCLIGTWHNSLMCDMTRWCVTWLVDVWHDSCICNVTMCTSEVFSQAFAIRDVCDMTQ